MSKWTFCSASVAAVLAAGCAVPTMQLQGSPRPEVLSALADSSSVFSGLWLTPRGSLVQLRVRDSVAVGTFVQRAPNDTSIAGDTVLRATARGRTLRGTYYALYSADHARDVLKCAKESSQDIEADTLLRSRVQLHLAKDQGQDVLTGTSAYVAGVFAAQCDDVKHIRDASDGLELRRIRDVNTPWHGSEYTGAQTDEVLREQLSGRGFMKGMMRAVAIAGAIDAAKRGDTATVTQALTTAVYTDSVLDAASGISSSPARSSSAASADASAATAGAEVSAATAGTGGAYVGLYAAEVRHLLSKQGGWKLSSCATCDDFVFPTVKLNRNSERDTYVAAAVMQAFAATNHAKIGKPKLAAEEATAMHNNLLQANKLCRPSAASFGGGGSGPQTLNIWSCPPPTVF